MSYLISAREVGLPTEARPNGRGPFLSRTEEEERPHPSIQDHQQSNDDGFLPTSWTCLSS